jgi:hypothetical protein
MIAIIITIIIIIIIIIAVQLASRMYVCRCYRGEWYRPTCSRCQDVSIHYILARGRFWAG